MLISKAEETILRFLQKNDSLQGITGLSESAINVAIEDLINKGCVTGSQNEQREYVKGFVIGSQNEQREYVKATVLLQNRGKLWLEQIIA